MRTLTKDYQLSVPSLVEIHRGLSHEAERAHDDLGLTVQGTRRAVEPKGAHLVNWLACYFLSLPVERRNEIILEGKDILEQHQDRDAPVKFGGAVRPRPPEEDGGSIGRKRRGA